MNPIKSVLLNTFIEPIKSEYERASFKEEVIAQIASNHFEGSVTQEIIDDPIYEVHEIDGSVRVKSIKAEVRQEKAAFWEKRSIFQIRLATLGKAVTVIAVVSIIAGVSLGSMGIAPAVILTVLAVTGVALAVFGHRKSSQANSQKSIWEKNIVLSTVEHRQKINEEGFLYLFKHQLKGQVVHNDEVKGVWKNWANQFFQRYSSRNNLEIAEIDSFFGDNPLNKDYLSYFEVGKEDETITIKRDQFQNHKHGFDSMRVRFKQLSEHINQLAESQLKIIDLSLDSKLLPYKLALNESKEIVCFIQQQANTQIQSDYDKRIKEIKNLSQLNPKQKKKMEKDTLEVRNAEIRRNEEKYKLMIEPYENLYEELKSKIIDSHHHLKDRIKEDLKSHLAKLVKDEGNQILKYKDAVVNISTDFFGTNEGEAVHFQLVPQEDIVFPSFDAIMYDFKNQQFQSPSSLKISEKHARLQF